MPSVYSLVASVNSVKEKVVNNVFSPLHIVYTKMYYCSSEYRVEIDVIKRWLAGLLLALVHMTSMVTARTMLALLPLALHHVSFMWSCNDITSHHMEKTEGKVK